MPILTRLYSPGSFGVYGLFLAIVGVGSVFATLRFEQGIVVTNNIKERRDLFALALGIALISVLVFYISFRAWGYLGPDVPSPISSVVVSLPALLALGIGLAGVENVFRMLALKSQAYKALSAAQILRSLMQAGIQLVLGLAAWLPSIALPLGAVIAPAMATSVYWWSQNRAQWEAIHTQKGDPISLRQVAKQNDIYPKFMVWSALCNSLANHAPVLIVGGLLSVKEAGALFLAYRVLLMPAKLLSRNISLVNLQEASEESGSDLMNLYKRRVSGMLAVGLLPLVAVIALSPWAFPVVFGAEWSDAGRVAQLLAPAVYVQFAFMSFLTLFTAMRAQRSYLAWSVIRLILIIGGLVGGAVYGNLEGAVVGLTCALSVSYIGAHKLIMHHLQRYRSKNLKPMVQDT